MFENVDRVHGRFLQYAIFKGVVQVEESRSSGLWSKRLVRGFGVKQVFHNNCE